MIGSSFFFCILLNLETEPKVEFVEGYEMEEEEDMEDFATGISGKAQRWL
jgi:hypothetical protein